MKKPEPKEPAAAIFIDDVTGEGRATEALDYTVDNTSTVSEPSAEFYYRSVAGVEEMRERKESVAAHQAECGCHPMMPKTGILGAYKCCDVDLYYVRMAHDSTDTLWHIDPLCKVRPEARG